jgi:hypothetical protein
LRKEVSFILVDAAEPIVMSDSFHGRDAKDLIAIGHGKRLDNGDFVDHVETVNAGQIHSLIECAVDDYEKSEKKKRNGE